MKRTLHGITISFTLIYIAVVLIGVIKKDYTTRLTITELTLIAAFLIFIVGFICSYDYPLISGVLFICWSISIRIFDLPETKNYLFPLFVFLASIVVLLLGISFVFYWWKTKSIW